MQRWHCKIDGVVYGPYPVEELRRLAREGRLLPTDVLREGTEGAWFAASRLRELFEEEGAARDDDDWNDDDRDASRPRGKSRKPSNYFRVLSHNFYASDAQWQHIIYILLALLMVLPLGLSVFAAIWSGGRWSAVLFGLLWTILTPALFLLVFFADVILFGLVCLAFRVRLDVRHHGVLDLFAFCYLIGVFLLMVRLCVALGSRPVSVLLTLVDPIVHAIVIGYFLHASWHLSVQRAAVLASVRFLYQTLIVGLYVAVMFSFFVAW